MDVLDSLLALSKKITNQTNKDHELFYEEYFYIQGYKITCYFVYESVTVNIKKGCNLKSYIFEFNGGKYGEKEKNKIESIFNLNPDLPPDLIIQELNKIGVKEL